MDKDCFGVYWEEHNPECCGGFDPVSRSRQTRCAVYEQCGRQFRMNQAASKLQTITPQTTQMSRPMHPSPPAPYRSTYKTAAPYSLPSRPSYQAQQTQQMQQPGNFYPAVYHPTLQLLPHESPPFLTVLETAPDVPRWQRVLAEAVRAAGKGALSHTTFVIDHLPFFQPPPEE